MAHWNQLDTVLSFLKAWLALCLATPLALFPACFEQTVYKEGNVDICESF